MSQLEYTRYYPMFDFITNILNIDKSRIKSFHVATVNGITNILITLNPDYPECPYCHGSSRIHGYSKPKQINHPVLTARKSIIVYTATRYRCRDCQKTFLEDNPFTFSTFKNSYFAMDQIMKDLRNIRMSYLDIARKNNVSVSTVQRYMDSFLVIPRQTLPVNLGIDEIHIRLAHYGNSKYLCILTDNENRTLMEILPSRAKLELSRYLEKIDKKERDRIRYVTMDMWLPYKQVVQRYLVNAQIAVDPFHVISHLMDGLSRLQIHLQNQVEYGSDAYYLLKTWKDFLEKQVDLDNKAVFNKRFQRYINKRGLLELILNINENLSLAYHLKERYLDFNKNATSSNCEKWFDTLYNAFVEADIPEYREFTVLLYNWREEILHSFARPFQNRKQSNAFTENINGQIRTYLAVSNGVINFIRFRKRMLYCLNYRIFYSIAQFLSSDKYDRKKK